MNDINNINFIVVGIPVIIVIAVTLFFYSREKRAVTPSLPPTGSHISYKIWTKHLGDGLYIYAQVSNFTSQHVNARFSCASYKANNIISSKETVDIHNISVGETSETRNRLLLGFDGILYFQINDIEILDAHDYSYPKRPIARQPLKYQFYNNGSSGIFSGYF